MKKVFLIILNWNQAELTIETLLSLEKLEKRGFELRIVVVDNGSDESLIKKIKDFTAGKKVYKFISNIGNLGFAGGNNVGIRYALKNDADYICVMNNDVLADRLMITNLLNEAEKHDAFGAMSPKIYFAKGYEFHKEKYDKDQLGKVIWYAGGNIDWDNIYGSSPDVDEVDDGREVDTKETDYATGTCIFLSAAALKEVGMFDERYFMYYEDTELSQRLKKNGYKVLYSPKAKMWHKVSQSSAIGSELNDYFITRNRLLFGVGAMGFGYASVRAKIALVKEALRLLHSGRKWQRIGAGDYFLANFGKGSWTGANPPNVFKRLFDGLAYPLKWGINNGRY